VWGAPAAEDIPRTSRRQPALLTGQFSEAAAAYTGCCKAGFVTGTVFNLGQCPIQSRAGGGGPSRVSLGQQHTPRDPDLRTNLLLPACK
jgi:hypothetical protein